MGSFPIVRTNNQKVLCITDLVKESIYLRDMAWKIGDMIRLIGRQFKVVGRQDSTTILAHGANTYRLSDQLILSRISNEEQT